MARKDFYEVLGLPKSASLDEIKKAYRVLARKHHPDIDKSSGAATQFKEISDAYQVLSNPEKRKAYDQFGHGAFDQNGNHAGSGGNPFGGGFGSYTQGGGNGNSGFDFTDFQDPFSIFEQFFAGASSGRARAKSGGDDLYYEITLDFKDAIFGVSKNVSIDKQTLCPVCLGSGAEKGSKVETCPQCQGKGQVQRVQNSIFGQIMTAAVCPTCHGTGQKITHPCPKCSGAGRIKEKVQQDIKIPAGVGDGDTVRFPSLGDMGKNGTKAGDLFLTIRVLPSREFRRRGGDIFSEVKIDLPTAVLGGTISVPTLTDPVKLKIPVGTQTGTEFRLRGLGVPGRGDQYVLVNLKTPTSLSKSQQELWQKLSGM